MTDSFIKSGTDTDTQDQGNLPNADQGSAGSQGQDTHSPEYQVSVMQKRINDKDEFIRQLQEEAQGVREKYASLEERIKNMESIEEALSKRNGQQQQGDNSQDTSLDEDTLVSKVIENLDTRTAKQKQEANYNQAVQRLTQEYGEKYVNDKVTEAAQANGLSIDDMVDTARKSPQAFYKLMGIDTQRNPQQRPAGQPSRSTFNSDAAPQSNEKDFAYYARLMRENPREYWKAETQREFRKLFQK